MLGLLRRFQGLSQQRRRHRRSSAPAACESLEGRCLLAVAGISTDVSSLKVAESSAVVFSVKWQPTGSGTADSVGMNVRLHYDSAALEFDSIFSRYEPGFSTQQDTTEAADRDDGEASTDRVTKLLWIDLNGTWPNLPPGSSLFSIQFTARASFVSTVVNVDASTVNDIPLPRRQVTVTQVPKLTGPAVNNTTARPVISWDSISTASSYAVWVSLSSETAPYLRATVSGTSFTPPADMELGQYQVWVQGNLTDGRKTGWSLPRVFDVRPRSTVTSPAGTISTSTPVIAWTPVTGAARYDLWIDNKTTGQSQFIRQQNLTTTQYPVSQPLPLGTYAVWIQPVTAASFRGTWSSEVRFTVATPPTLLAPRNPTFETRPTFSWSPVAGADRYDLWVRNITTGQDQVIRERSLTTTSFTPGFQMPNATYFWWVQAIRTGGPVSEWGGGRFSVGGRPELLTPVGTTSDPTPTFQWSAVGGALSYDLWVDRIGGPSQIIRQPVVISNSFTPVTALLPGTYRFWVRALSSTGVLSAWSLEQQFTIS